MRAMSCPGCNTELKMSERHGVEIDYCPACRGVWLDRGELDKIIQREASHLLNERGDTYDRDDYYDRERREGRDYKGRRRRGFLGDLFDFD